MKSLVAVYGSLKKGFYNHHHLSGAEFIGEGGTDSIYEMYKIQRSYPGVTDGESKIQVEVYAVTESELRRLDRLEGHPSFYKRETANITLNNGEKISAFVYKLPRSYKSENSLVLSEDEKGRKIWLQKT